MKRVIDLATEARLLAAYGATLVGRSAATVHSQLRCSCREFRRLQPQESLLNHAHTTHWVGLWRDAQLGRCSPKVVVLRLQAVRRWQSWAFERGELDDNALAYVSPTHLIDGTVPSLKLRHNLQRAIATYLSDRGSRLEDTRLHYRCYLDRFNVFINRRLGGEAEGHPINEGALLAWLRELWSRYTTSTTWQAAGIVNGFLDFLHETGRLAHQPLAELLSRYPSQTRRQVLLSILGRPQDEPLPSPAASPRFVSGLASHLEAYLKLMRAVGRRYDRVEQILQQLDRFVAKEKAGEVILTRDLLSRWVASTPHLAPSTQRAHVSAARQFCRYMARIEPRTWVPDRSLDPARLPHLRPHVFSSCEVRDLLAVARQLPNVRWPLAPQAVHALLLVLYATGLRVSEALRLRIRDVDLDSHTLFIAETKFFKSRWVPFSASLADQLRAYVAARTGAVSVVRPDDAFFINSYRKRYGYSRVAGIFRQLMRQAGIDAQATRRRRPRLHDLRGTFAVNCVLRWYREGADVQAKLPLLATYLGHGNILATHVYLNATAEVLREASQRFEHACGSLMIAPQKENHDDVR